MPKQLRVEILPLNTPTDSSMFSLPLLSAIGLIRVNWRNRNNEIVSINYGTGFAVNKKLIVTCMHNLFSERLDALASEIIFIPGIDGRSRDDSRLYKCTNKSNIKYVKTTKSFAYSPLKEEVVLFKLDDDQEVDSPSFVKLGAL
jgi:hypothetical protein